MTHYQEIFFVFIVQLFIVVDPFAGVPVFLAITPHKTWKERRSLARRGCAVACLLIVFFLTLGPYLLRYFGIQLMAVQICGGILLFVIALELLYGRTTGAEITSREARLAGEKEDISVTPLAIPLLAGPGAIATSIIFAGRSTSLLETGVLVGGAAAVFAATYFFLHWADHLQQFVGDLGMTIMTRIVGLIIAFISVQYVIDGVHAVISCGLPPR